jgi:hypothetical protein
MSEEEETKVVASAAYSTVAITRATCLVRTSQNSEISFFFFFPFALNKLVLKYGGSNRQYSTG